jgi:prolyl oligopeptidase
MAEDLPDLVQWSKFSNATWLMDSSGFYYARYEEPKGGMVYAEVNYHQKLYFHKIGTSQAEDHLIYERPDQKEWGFDPIIADDGRYLILHVWQGTDTRNRVFYQDLYSNSSVKELISDLHANYQFVGNDGSMFYFRTDFEAPRGKLIAIDIDSPDRVNWETVIPEIRDLLESVKIGKSITFIPIMMKMNVFSTFILSPMHQLSTVLTSTPKRAK